MDLTAVWSAPDGRVWRPNDAGPSGDLTTAWVAGARVAGAAGRLAAARSAWASSACCAGPRASSATAASAAAGAAIHNNQIPLVASGRADPCYSWKEATEEAASFQGVISSFL